MAELAPPGPPHDPRSTRPLGRGRGLRTLVVLLLVVVLVDSLVLAAVVGGWIELPTAHHPTPAPTTLLAQKFGVTCGGLPPMNCTQWSNYTFVRLPGTSSTTYSVLNLTLMVPVICCSTNSSADLSATVSVSSPDGVLLLDCCIPRGTNMCWAVGQAPGPSVQLSVSLSAQAPPGFWAPMGVDHCMVTLTSYGAP